MTDNSEQSAEVGIEHGEDDSTPRRSHVTHIRGGGRKSIRPPIVVRVGSSASDRARMAMHEDGSKAVGIRVVPHGERRPLSLVSAQSRVGVERYRLERLIGQGASGQVYLASDRLLEMPVAIKLLDPSLVRDPEAVAALKREARVTMELSHRHILRLYNLMRNRASYYLVMEHINGTSLRAYLRQFDRLSPETVAGVVEVCADALGHAHRHGVIHADLKPDNLLVGDDHVLKVIDFGIARLRWEAQKRRVVEGTPAYMSPEQVRGEELGPETDVYALGITAYELLAGAVPFPPGAGIEDILRLMPPRLDGVDDGIAAVLRRAVAVNPAERWPTAGAFAIELKRAIEAAGPASGAQAVGAG